MIAVPGEGEDRLDFKALGRHFEARRVALGMRPGEFAVFARVSSEASVGGGQVRALELYGKPCLRTIVRVAKALGIDDASVLALCGLDLARLRAEWEAWAAEPVPVVLSIRAVPGFWIQRDPPDGLDRDGIRAWADPLHPSQIRCIRWSRKHATYLRPDGTSYDIHSTFGDDDPGPTMSGPMWRFG